MKDAISRQAAIELASGACHPANLAAELAKLPAVQPERLTDDDLETIRIHLSAIKERLCNQHRWEEAAEYERIIDRLMTFASAEPERKKGNWVGIDDEPCDVYECDRCGTTYDTVDSTWDLPNFCPNCGADMRGEQDG